MLTETEARQPARLPARRRRLPRRDRPSPGALAASARSLRRRRAAARCAIGSIASAARTRAGWTTSRCSWPSRMRTVSRPGRRGSPTSRSAIHRRSRSGRRRCAREIRLHKLTQFLFFEQWQRVRDACRARSIQIMGDLPIFVAHDSADVWARRELFRLDADGAADRARRRAAGLFQRDRAVVGKSPLPVGCARTDRIPLVDRSISCPAGAGRSRPHRSFPRLRSVVGSAGRCVDGHTRRVGERAGRVALRGSASGAAHESAALRRREPRRHHAGGRGAARGVGVSGDGDPPVRVRRRRAGATISSPTTTRETSSSTPARTTTTPPWAGGPAQPGTARDRTPRSRRERELARRYLGLDGRDVHWEFIRAALASVADTAIVPAQDLLGLGSEARMNRPGTVTANWRWRLAPGELTAETARRLASMAETYGRV